VAHLIATKYLGPCETHEKRYSNTKSEKSPETNQENSASTARPPANEYKDSIRSALLAGEVMSPS
jgi:hypothetical protein